MSITTEKIDRILREDGERYERATHSVTKHGRIRRFCIATAFSLGALTAVNEAVEVVPDAVQDVIIVGGLAAAMKARSSGRAESKARKDSEEILFSAAALANPKYYPDTPLPVSDWLVEALPPERASALKRDAEVWGNQTIAAVQSADPEATSSQQ